ncbi:hypothetical protein CERZMDRAFT_99351 [Cercospora zeae-maydis SCOH1-5]|uniref:Uncharacterized protein n=1 Tax=Cercospora zeae-maydis SCOH1-5 TaxID=717836 RepID=A0A6A6FBH6_9PEZI|nr:hypothetical protein CERZMDRAFT_99351 [Cercospora zeae-maydis SCOH1-5]
MGDRLIPKKPNWAMTGRTTPKSPPPWFVVPSLAQSSMHFVIAGLLLSFAQLREGSSAALSTCNSFNTSLTRYRCSVQHHALARLIRIPREQPQQRPLHSVIVQAKIILACFSVVRVLQDDQVATQAEVPRAEAQHAHMRCRP